MILLWSFVCLICFFCHKMNNQQDQYLHSSINIGALNLKLLAFLLRLVYCGNGTMCYIIFNNKKDNLQVIVLLYAELASVKRDWIIRGKLFFLNCQSLQDIKVGITCHETSAYNYYLLSNSCSTSVAWLYSVSTE